MERREILIWNAIIVKKMVIYQEIVLKMAVLHAITAVQTGICQEIAQKGT